ncbi:MAG: Glycosyltransferase AglI [Candidatus Methanolliviera sp. GoM_oil]|nr:MAG: Glycosyltransferase AglI [Candidatus Methanolliviera sp. GoM_oil]
MKMNEINEINKKKVSVIVTVKNEEKHISKLLDSLIIQEKPLEIVVVDSASTDKTTTIVEACSKKYDFVKLIEHEGSRGESRNFGCEKAAGDIYAFIDGDCTADKDWVKELRDSLKTSDFVAGKTLYPGKIPNVAKIPLYINGIDVSYPSCNLAYRKECFPVFNPWFKTAEDIDLNLRAVEDGARFVYDEKAVVHHNVREDFRSFVKQSFWYGFGRGQLFIKHKRTGLFSPANSEREELNFWAILKKVSGALGLIIAIMVRGDTRL